MGEVAGREGIGRIKHIFPTVSPRAVFKDTHRSLYANGSMFWRRTKRSGLRHAAATAGLGGLLDGQPNFMVRTEGFHG